MDRLWRWLVPGMMAAVTLAVAPGAEAPFSSAKTAVLGACSAALLVRALLVPSTPAQLAPRVLAGLWLGTLALSALLGLAAHPHGLWLQAAAGLVMLSLLQAPPEPGLALRAVAGSGTVLALVAGLQWVGWDPFHWVGWSSLHPGERMRVYGTLGNPDFVAAYLGASLCVTLGESRRAAGVRLRQALLAAAALQLGALATTRSWGSLLALGAAALSLLWTGRPQARAQGHEPREPQSRWSAVAGVVLAGALLVFAVWGRSPGNVLAGRVYLWSVAAPRLLETPVWGYGPGSFEVLWPQWEARYWAQGASEEQERFIGLQDHAHMDYLEWWVELGVVGLVPRLLLLAAALRAGRLAVDARARATLAALVALAVRALTDFPLERPAELCLFAVLLVLTLSRERARG